VTSQNPTWQDSLSYAGFDLRRSDALLSQTNGTGVGALSGIRPGGGYTTTLSGTTISVSAGTAFVYFAGQGMYRAAMSTTWTATLQAADATLTRIDLVYLRVWDNDVDGSGLRKSDPVYLPGTPSASPSAPTPSGTQIYIPLATITVPPVGGGSASVSTAVRPVTVAPGGILPASTAPSSPYTGMAWHDGTDLKVWNGSAWDVYQKANTVNWTTASLGTGYTQGDTTTNGNLNGPIRYRTFTDRGTPYMEWDGGATRATGAQVTNILASALSSGLRPAARASFAIARNATNISGVSGSTSAIHTCKIDFNQDGTVSLVSATAGVDETTWFALKNIKYPLA
jgi:hypothetical protein